MLDIFIGGRLEKQTLIGDKLKMCSSRIGQTLRED
jgi:hypothetical protein